jgi:AraC family transcriptional regulator, transcriptional activator of pobA
MNFTKRQTLDIEQFIIERILLEAKSLLTHTELNIAEISHNLQFDEPTNFSKFFKKYVGLTPLQFRHRKQKD